MQEKIPHLCFVNQTHKLAGILVGVEDNVLLQNKFLEYFCSDRIIDVSLLREVRVLVLVYCVCRQTCHLPLNF